MSYWQRVKRAWRLTSNEERAVSAAREAREVFWQYGSRAKAASYCEALSNVWAGRWQRLGRLWRALTGR